MERLSKKKFGGTGAIRLNDTDKITPEEPIEMKKIPEAVVNNKPIKYWSFVSEAA